MCDNHKIDFMCSGILYLKFKKYCTWKYGSDVPLIETGKITKIYKNWIPTNPLVPAYYKNSISYSS